MFLLNNLIVNIKKLCLTFVLIYYKFIYINTICSNDSALIFLK